MSTTTPTEFPFVAWYTEGVDDYTAISVTIHPPYTDFGDHGYEANLYEIVVDYTDDQTGENMRDVHYYDDPGFAPRSAREILDYFEAEFLHEYFPPQF